jgi:hypothetical protein
MGVDPAINVPLDHHILLNLNAYARPSCLETFERPSTLSLTRKQTSCTTARIPEANCLIRVSDISGWGLDHVGGEKLSLALDGLRIAFGWIWALVCTVFFSFRVLESMQSGGLMDSVSCSLRHVVKLVSPYTSEGPLEEPVDPTMLPFGTAMQAEVAGPPFSSSGQGLRLGQRAKGLVTPCSLSRFPLFVVSMTTFPSRATSHIRSDVSSDPSVCRGAYFSCFCGIGIEGFGAATPVGLIREPRRVPSPHCDPTAGLPPDVSPNGVAASGKAAPVESSQRSSTQTSHRWKMTPCATTSR